MNWYSLFYWFTVVDKISVFSTVLAAFATIITIIAFGCVVFNDSDGYNEDTYAKGKKIAQWGWPISLLCWIVSIFIPTKKDILLIVAGGSVGSFIQKDSSIQALPSDVTRYLHISLQKEVEDLSTESKEELGLSSPKDKLIDKVKDMSKDEIIELLQTDTTILKNKLQ